MDNLNLTTDRAPRSVWDEPSAPPAVSHLQTMNAGRAAAVAGGAALAAAGFRRGGLLGGFLAALGGVLAYRAITGHSDLTQARSWTRARLQQHGWLHDRVDEAAEESFPASDAPAH